MPPSRRILILMSNTGGGHRASALALKAGFEERYPRRFHIDIVDLLMDHTPWPLRELPKAYPFLSNRAPWAWKALYATENYPRVPLRIMEFVSTLTAGSVRRVLTQMAPDLIISVHPLVHQLTFRVLNAQSRHIPTVTVVTDLASVHPLWYHPQVDACYVASTEAVDAALQAGLRRDQVHLFGLPVRPAFGRPVAPKPELRRQLKMAADLPAVLLVGGGEGVGPVEQIALQIDAHLSRSGRPCGQMVVVCGRNQSLRAGLEMQRWHIPVQINGFVEDMPAWMNACDCLVTKAGPGTIAEALICGLPIVLSGFIPGQEEGNVPFVVDNRAGVFHRDPAEIGETVAHWFGSGRAELADYAVNARRLGHPQATSLIVESIASLLA